MYAFLPNFEILVKTFRKKFRVISFRARNFRKYLSVFLLGKELSTTFSNKSTHISGGETKFYPLEPPERHVRHHLNTERIKHRIEDGRDIMERDDIQFQRIPICRNTYLPTHYDTLLSSFILY